MDPLPIAALVAVVTTAAGAVYLHEWVNRRMAEKRLSQRPPLDADHFGNTYFGESPGRAQLAADLRRLMAKYVPYKLDGLSPDDRLVADLRMDQLDSLCLMQLTAEIERQYGITVSSAAAESILTFRELVDHLEPLVARSGEGLDNKALHQSRRWS